MSAEEGTPVFTFESKVGAALQSVGFGAEHVVLAAVSGGPDSTALTRALAALRTAHGLSLAACIVDHGIRPPEETAADVAFARALCSDLGIPLIVKTVPAGECARRARTSRRSLEEEARDLRHSLLREAAEGTGAAVIALGHTQDDVIETLLMRVMQGSGVHGLRGIPSRRGPFFRPMLDCTRRQVLEYLGSLGQDWREDSSNDDTSILRNRVRRRLVPVLDAEFPGFRTGLLVLSRKLALSADLVSELGRRLRWARSGAGFSRIPRCGCGPSCGSMTVSPQRKPRAGFPGVFSGLSRTWMRFRGVEPSCGAMARCSRPGPGSLSGVPILPGDTKKDIL